MVLLLASLALAAPTVQLTFAVDGRGSRVVAQPLRDAPPLPRDAERLGPHPLLVQVLDAQGHVLASVHAADPRHRTLVDPAGQHLHATLAAGTTSVQLPVPAGAAQVRIDGQIHPLAFAPPTHPVRALPPPAAQALVTSGPSDERLDLLFLGDGYTQGELGDFADDVDRIVAYLLDIEPYGEYAGLFNVWRVDVASAESGASDDLLGVSRDTAFGCAYGCAGLDRLICCDDTAVLSAVGAAVPGAEGVMVLVNSDEYGGSGGFTYATSYVGTDFGPEVAAHELGHSLVGLWDEYGYGIDGTGAGPNCAVSDEGDWGEWLGTDGVDAFPECSYNALHRPTLEGCMMRTLQDDYCPVCRQEAVLAMYERLPSLFVSVSPTPGTVAVEPPPFAAEVVDEGLTVEWYLGDDLIHTGADFAPECFAAGGELTVLAYDATPWVRADDEGVLTQREGPWFVSPGTCATPATVTDPSRSDDTGDDGDAFVCSCATGPSGSLGASGSLGTLLLLVPWWRRRRLVR